MAVDPGSYLWLLASDLEAAGCLTVVPDADFAAVAAAFGADPTATVAREEVATVGGSWAWFVRGGGSVVVVEENGFQGTRREVLGPVSKVSATGKAASVFWNVNGSIQFTCTRRGKPAGSIELDVLDEDDLAEIPRSLRRLAAMCTIEDSDAVAVGAAMVEAYTGVAFGPEVLTRGVALRLTPPPADLVTPEADGYVLHDDTVLRDRIVALAPQDQRALAAWVARAAVAEAGMADEPHVAAMLDQLLTPQTVPDPVPGLDALAARIARASDEHDRRALSDYDLHYSIENEYRVQRWAAVYVARHLAHRDPLAAALICTAEACTVFGASWLDRAVVLVDHKRGRRMDRVTPNHLRQRFVELLERLTLRPSSEWDAFVSDLPTPLTTAERADAIRRDNERRDNGEFFTYDTTPDPGYPTPLVEYTADSPDNWTVRLSDLEH